MKKLCLFILASASIQLFGMEEKKEAAAEVAAIPAEIVINLPDGKKEFLKTAAEDGLESYTATSFADLIEAQAQKNDAFILARVVTKEGKKPYYLNAHALNSDLFRDMGYYKNDANRFNYKQNAKITGYPIKFQALKEQLEDENGYPTGQTKVVDYTDYYAVPQTAEEIDTSVGIQYFIYDTKKPQDGLVYLCTYRAGKGFFNDTVGSPYRGKSQDYFLDVFYANQNEAPEAIPPFELSQEDVAKAKELKQLKAGAKERIKPSFRDLYNQGVSLKYRKQFNEAVDLLEKAYEIGQNFEKFEPALHLADIYFYGRPGVPKDYKKAQKFYEILTTHPDPMQHNAAQGKLAEIKKLIATPPAEEKKESAAVTVQRARLIELIRVGKNNFEQGDADFNFLRASDNFAQVYREAARDAQLEDLFQEAAYYLGILSFKGGRSVPVNNQKAIEYFDAIKNGPFLAQAQKYLLDIALAESMSQQARPQAPREQGVERKRDLAAEAAERKRALEQSKEDLDYAAALVASLATVTSEEEDLARAIELSRAINVPAQQQYGQEIKRRAEEPVLAQGTNVGPELQLLAHELQALQTAVR